MKFRYLLLLFTFIFYNFPICGQGLAIDLLNGEDKKSIPFKYVNGYLVVDIIYGILPLKFLIDTGASHNILFKKDINDVLNIPYTDTINVTGSDLTGGLKALVVRSIPFKISDSDIVYRDVIVLEENILDIEKLLGERIDGMLGGSFFRGLVLEFNYKKAMLTIYHPEKYKQRKGFTAHEIDIKNFKPYITTKTKVGDVVDSLKYLLDTGASLALLIHSNKDNFEIPENSVEGSLGRGLSGDITGYVGVVNHIDVGKYHIPNVITNFQEVDSTFLLNGAIIRDGIIGNSILSRFHFVIDYFREILYLKPATKLTKAFKYDKSGLLIYSSGLELNEYYIEKVYEGTPAYKAGIQKGDRIIKIGFWPLRFYTLPKIIKKLQGKDGKKIKMVVLRNDEKLKFSFQLRDRFNR